MPKQKPAKRKVNFSFTAPEAHSVELAGDFTGWQQAPVALKKDKSGVWKKTVSLPPGRYEYRLLVDDQWCDDPQCPNRQPNQFGGENCVCIVEGSGKTCIPPSPVEVQPMEYERKSPVTKAKRSARRERERSAYQQKEERNRKRSQGGGQPNELGVIQGQNGEQGNTIDPRNAQPIGQPGSK